MKMSWNKWSENMPIVKLIKKETQFKLQVCNTLWSMGFQHLLK